MKEAIGTGKTVEAAVAAALAELGAERDEAQIEVLEMPKEKLFGLLGGNEAKVKVTVAEKEESVDEGGRRNHRSRRRGRGKSDRFVPLAEGEAVSTDKGEPLGTAAEKYVTEILTLMGIRDFTVTARKGVNSRGENALFIYVEGPSLGPVIGKKGETLDALQHLCNLINRHDDATPSRVVLDAGDYRVKREEYLTSAARRAIDRALRDTRNVALEPMNAAERRFIHTIVQDTEGVSSKSVGEEPRRRVIVSADGAPEYEERENNRRERRERGDRGGRRDRRERRDSVPYEREAGKPIGRRDDYVPHAKRDVSVHRTYSDAVFESKANDGELFSLYEKIEPKFPSMEEVGFVAPVEKKDEE